MNENQILQYMHQLEVEYSNSLSRWNELKRWLMYCLEQQVAQQSVQPTLENDPAFAEYNQILEQNGLPKIGGSR